MAKEFEKNLAFASAGQQKVKNIKDPIDAYNVRTDIQARPRVLHKGSIGRRWWPFGIPAAVATLAAGWIALYHPLSSASSTPTSIPSVAVLPFKDLSADKSVDYLGDGVADDIIAMLSRNPDIAVVSRTSSFAYKGKNDDIRQIGKELGVGYLVEGSVRKEGDRIRIVAELIDARTGDHAWADRFDKAGTDPWALQDELTGNIVTAMTGEWGAIRKADYGQAWGKDSTNLAEYDYFLRAQSQQNLFTNEGLERAGEILWQGLQAFPDSPLLTVELGWVHC